MFYILESKRISIGFGLKGFHNYNNLTFKTIEDARAFIKEHDNKFPNDTGALMIVKVVK